MTTAIRNPFKSPFLRDNFAGAVSAFEKRDALFFTRSGIPHRGNGWASNFWRGFHGTGFICIPRNTPAHAFYRAGEACARKYGRVNFPMPAVTFDATLATRTQQ